MKSGGGESNCFEKRREPRTETQGTPGELRSTIEKVSTTVPFYK